MPDIYFRPDGPNRFQIRSAANGKLPSEWLDQEYNKIYSHLNTIGTGGGSSSGSEWTDVDVEATMASTTSFTIEGDYTVFFETYRAIKLVDSSDAVTYSHIKSSTYVAGTNTTTVVLYDAVVPASIKSISVGLISESASTIPSVKWVQKDAAYTVGAEDQIIIVDDHVTQNLHDTYDDEQVGDSSTSYKALLITLPVASSLPNKLLFIKKTAGTNRTIVSAAFTESTTGSGSSAVHHNTYAFQIYGGASLQNRITLFNVGDGYWFYSTGTSWYVFTPVASETITGISRFATDAEMTLTAQQISDGDSLRKDLAVSPYNLDAHFLRSDASNMHFASNYIYAATNNNVAAISSNNIIVYSGLGLSIPNGKDTNGNLLNKQIMLASNIQYQPSGTAVWQALFVNENGTSVTVAPMRNCLEGYYFHQGDLDPRTANGENVIFYDWTDNRLKISTNRGSSFSNLMACGPICYYKGNGTYVTTIRVKRPVGFLTRDFVYAELPRQMELLQRFDYTSRESKSFDQEYTAVSNGLLIAHAGKWQSDVYEMRAYIDGQEFWGQFRGGSECMTFVVSAGQRYRFTTNGDAAKWIYFIPAHTGVW